MIFIFSLPIRLLNYCTRSTAVRTYTRMISPQFFGELKRTGALLRSTTGYGFRFSCFIICITRQHHSRARNGSTWSRLVFSSCHYEYGTSTHHAISTAERDDLAVIQYDKGTYIYHTFSCFRMLGKRNIPRGHPLTTAAVQQNLSTTLSMFKA